MNKKNIWIFSGSAVFISIATVLLLSTNNHDTQKKTMLIDAQIKSNEIGKLREAANFPVAPLKKLVSASHTLQPAVNAKPPIKKDHSGFPTKSTTQQNKKNDPPAEAPQYDPTIYQFLISPPSGLGANATSWKEQAISIAEVTEKRKRLAKGERIFARHILRPEDPILYERKKYRERQQALVN